MHRFSPLFSVTLLLLAPGTLDAQSVSSEDTTVVAVEVPVQVLLDGQPVRGLTADDFELLDGRKRREILDFDVVDLTSLEHLAPTAQERSKSSQAPLPSVARRHFLLLFDLSFADPQSVVKAREAATRLVTEQFHPTDLVAVATYSGAQGVRLLHSFTSDRRQVAFAIETLGAPQLIQTAPDPLGLLFSNLEGASDNLRAQNRAGDAIAEALIDFARALERQERRQMSERIVQLSESFADLARLMGGVAGRKHVLYLSEGFDTSVLFGTTDRGAQQRMNRAVEEGRVWEVDSDEKFGDARSQGQLERMLEEFRRADCTVQTIDIGGIRSTTDVQQGSRREMERKRSSLSGRDDALGLIAGATGGQHIRNFNDLSRAMGEVLERTSLTYILTFQPKDLDLDGKYRRLKVRLKDGPKEARVVHRPGYYAPTPYSEISDPRRRLSNSELLLAGEEGGALLLHTLAVPSLPEGNTAQDLNWVSVLLALDGPSLLSSRGKADSLELEVFSYAFDLEGRIRDFLSHSMVIDLSKVGAQVERGGLEFFGHLDLPPGVYRVRTLVRDRRSGHFGLRQQDLQVPDFANEPALFPPLLVGALGRTLLVREDLSPGETLPAYPFLLDQQPFLPDPRLQAVRGTPAEFALFHHGSEAEPQLQLLDENGLPVPEGNRALTRAKGSDLHRLRFTLDTRRVPVGSYFLEASMPNIVHRLPLEMVDP